MLQVFSVILRLSCNVAGVSCNVPRVSCNFAPVSCNVAHVSCNVAGVFLCRRENAYLLASVKFGVCATLSCENCPRYANRVINHSSYVVVKTLINQYKW